MSNADAAADRRQGRAIELGDFKAAFKRFKDDEMLDAAAGLTYYFLMALFPALLFAVAALGVFGQEGLITESAEYLTDAGAPESTVNSVTSALESAQAQRGAAITAFVIGLAISLNGASGAFAASGRALNRVWRVEEGRGFVRRKAGELMWTLLVLVLVMLTMVLIFVGGGIAADILGEIGLGDTAADVWRIVRWPLALATALLVYAVVYYAAPNVEVRRFKYITPGSVFGVVMWLIASGLFFFYVSNFSSYSATYGAFAGAVILLVWLWLSGAVMLLGAELNAVIELRRSPGMSEDYEGPPLPAKEPAESA